MPARSSQTEQKPTFIFNGTIKKLKSATMDDVPVNDRTAVVTVDNILEAPPALTDYAGHDITVQIGGRAKLKVGDKMTFYTTSWMYGDSIAVRSLKQEPLKGESTATRGATAGPSERNAQRKTREHYNKATLVISGKVISVSTPDELAQESAAPSEKAPGGPVSEHDPEWREAVVEVSDVHKGSKKKRVVVRFPASTDVMWYGAPKFHPGQQGYFMLHKAKGQAPKTKQAKKRRSKRVAGATAEPKPETKEVYTVLDPEDFQSYQELGGIKSIIETESTEDKK